MIQGRKKFCVLGDIRSAIQTYRQLEIWGFPGDSVVKNPPARKETQIRVSGPGISPGEGNGNPLQYSCLGNPMDRGAWQATVLGVTKSRTRLSYYHTQGKVIS